MSWFLACLRSWQRCSTDIPGLFLTAAHAPLLSCSGSCWIWAALAAVESKVLIQYNKQASSSPLHLAEEQMVDCFGRNGCNGGWPTEAFDWIAKRGIVQEGYYPVRLHAGGSHCSPTTRLLLPPGG